jgi:hypothetical protein
MFFHIRIFLYSIAFFVVAQFVSSDYIGNIIASLSAKEWWLAGILFFAILVYFYQIAKRVSQRWSMTPMPVLFTLSTWGLLYFVQSRNQQYVLITLAAIAYYLVHISLYRLNVYYKDRTARGIIAAGSISTFFLFYAMSYGIYLNFNIPLWILILVLTFVTMLISFQYFWLINENKKNVLNYSLVLGLVMAEIVWVLNFWPFGYLTTGVITLIFYYVFWDLVRSHFLDELSKKRVVANMIFFGFLVALVLSSTRWLPIV